MIERNSEQKFDIEYIFHAELSNGESVKVDKAASADIVGGGIFLYADEVYPLREGMQVYLIITLPEKKFKAYTISKVIDIKQVDQGPGRKFKIIFRFLSIKDEDKKAIMDFITS